MTLKIKYVKLEEKLLWEDNPRDHDEENIEDMINSFRDYGFITPVVFSKEVNAVIAGNGRVLGLLELRQRWLKSPKKEEILEMFNNGYSDEVPDVFIPLGIQVKKDDWYLPTIDGTNFGSKEQAIRFAIDENNMVIGRTLPAGTVAASVWNLEDYMKMLQSVGPTVTVKATDIDFIESMVMQTFTRKEEELPEIVDDEDEDEEKQFFYRFRFSDRETKERFVDIVKVATEGIGPNTLIGDVFLDYLENLT